MSNTTEIQNKYDDLKEVFTIIRNQEPENLRCLYDEHSARMRHSGSQIWIIGTIFIRLSLSGMIFGLNDPTRVIPVAVFSIILIWIWYYISKAIRVSLDKDLAVCAALETVLLNRGIPMVRSGLSELVGMKYKFRGFSLWRIRYMIALLVTLVWITLAFVSLLI